MLEGSLAEWFLAIYPECQCPLYLTTKCDHQIVKRDNIIRIILSVIVRGGVTTVPYFKVLMVIGLYKGSIVCDETQLAKPTIFYSLSYNLKLKYLSNWGIPSVDMGISHYQTDS